MSAIQSRRHIRQKYLICVCFLITLLCLIPPSEALASSSERHPVLLVSIDGMLPRYVLEADRLGLHIPVLRRFVENGAYAESVVNVSPTLTYPNHTTLVTGVLPSEHGIYNNRVFDPMGTEQGAWNWYASQVRVPTLWQAAKDAELVTASVLWPVTVNSPSIDYNIPEYWRTKTEYDHFLLEAVSTPQGFLESLEKENGDFYAGNDDIEFDKRIANAAIATIKRARPDLLTVHLVSLDHLSHAFGPFSKETTRELEMIDGLLGRMIEAEVAVHPDAVIAVVSDHGFASVQNIVNLNAVLASDGLITISGQKHPKVSSWKAYAWSADGSAVIVLKDPSDKATEEKVAKLLARLDGDSRFGIERVLGKADAIASGAPPNAAFLIDWRDGFSMGPELVGVAVETKARKSGAHGYMNTHPGLHSSFFVSGPGVAPHKNLGTIDMRQIAPTLARELGVALPSAKQPALSIHAEGDTVTGTRMVER